MIDLKECVVSQLMPEAFRKDPQIQALSHALQSTASMLLEKTDRVSVYAAVDILPDKILDLLAEEFRAQYYSAALPIEDKRAAIKKALTWFIRAGTVSAVEELTNLVWRSDSARVQEWFDYDSAPYLFRILLGTDLTIEEERINVFFSSLRRVKNTRSHLESITFERQINHRLYVGEAVRSQGNVIIIDNWKSHYEMQETIYVGMAAAVRPSRIIIREG